MSECSNVSAAPSDTPLDLALLFEQYGTDVDEGDECQGSETVVGIEDDAAECWVCGATWEDLATDKTAALIPIHKGAA